MRAIMKKRLFFELLALVLLISCILAYVLLFIWKIEYYTSLAVALIFPSLVVVCGTFITRIKDRRRFLRESLIVLASCVNYGCVFLLTVLFHFDISIFLVTVTALSFSVSILILNVGRSIGYICFSSVTGAVICIIALLSPPLAYGQMWAVNYALEAAIQPVARLLLFGIVFSFVGAIVGSFVSDAF
jgi:hypothetical protein